MAYLVVRKKASMREHELPFTHFAWRCEHRRQTNPRALHLKNDAKRPRTPNSANSTTSEYTHDDDMHFPAQQWRHGGNPSNKFGGESWKPWVESMIARERILCVYPQYLDCETKTSFFCQFCRLGQILNIFCRFLPTFCQFLPMFWDLSQI